MWSSGGLMPNPGYSGPGVPRWFASLVETRIAQGPEGGSGAIPDDRRGDRGGAA
jgi:hypothetical protein